MEAGELELKKAFEEVTTKNVKVMLEYGKKTREIVRECEIKINKLEEMLRINNETIQQLKLQLSSVQTKVYSGGT